MSKHLGDRLKVVSIDFERDGFKGAEDHEHDVIGVVLLSELLLLYFGNWLQLFCGITNSHSKYK